MAAGTPRFDHYQKLIYRFFEPLIVLKLLLGKGTLGPHRVSNHDPNNLVSILRRFLKNLAYICDFRKGGETTTSIGVEERFDCFKFWIALNTDEPGVDVVCFLESILFKLKESLELSETEQKNYEKTFLQACIGFSYRRVQKEAKNLSRTVKHGKRFLVRSQDRDLSEWLSQFEFSSSDNLVHMCQRAFGARHHFLMRDLNSRCQYADTENNQNERDTVEIFCKIRHFLGRVAHHVRAAKELLSDVQHVKNLLDIYSVERIPLSECVPRPPKDHHTNMKGIFRRMTRPSDPRYKSLEENIPKLNLLFPERGFETEISDYFRPDTDVTRKPRVHSEVQALEHFYRNGLYFAYNDRFIATSKMACICCKLYFQYHPARCAEPDSHEKVYVNWGPINLPDGRGDPQFTVQRDVMNKIIEHIREAALDKILGLTMPWPFHSDSLSGFTVQVNKNSRTGEPGSDDCSDVSSVISYNNGPVGSVLQSKPVAGSTAADQTATTLVLETEQFGEDGSDGEDGGVCI